MAAVPKIADDLLHHSTRRSRAKTGCARSAGLKDASNDPLPVAERPQRVAALERELDDLYRLEEALVAAALATGEPVHRSPSAQPAAVLGVRIADRASRAA